MKSLLDRGIASSRRLAAVLLAVVAVAAMSSAAHSQAADREKITSAIATQIGTIDKEPSAELRKDLAFKLSDLVKELNPTDADVKVIDGLAGLLRDRDDSVRYWAAVSLGYLGQAAQRAAPALMTALRECECDLKNASKMSAPAIRFALEEMGAEAPEHEQIDCKK
jgi:hypothetical protein